MSRRLRIRFRIDLPEGGVDPAEPLQEHEGACDSLLLIALLGEPADGEDLEAAIMGVDGKTGDNLSLDAMFLAWVGLAWDLGNHLPEGGKRDLCQAVHRAVSDALKATRKPDEPKP